jgi:DNA-binding LacI/PurR family transcriptional regulator
LTEAHNKQATLHDVARLANVSHQTVSRVINNSPNVADETRKRVNEAIETLKYRPNRAARSLITGKSQTLQIIDFEANYLTPIPAIIAQANLAGYRTGVSIVRDPASREELQILLDDLTSRLVDGFLLFDPMNRMGADELDRLCRGVPYVQLGGEPVEDVPAVLIDHAEGVRQAMSHLFWGGHQRIAEISGPMDFFDGRIRHETYQACMAEANLDSKALWREGNFSSARAYEITKELLCSISDGFTAIVCGNDETALGALRALHEVGICVPEEVSVVGYDDHPQVRFYEPPLTTVRQDYFELSRLGVEYLVCLIEERNTLRTHKVIKPDLIIRESTSRVR